MVRIRVTLGTLVLLALASLALSPALSFSPLAAQDITVRIVEEPYRETYAFLGIYFESLGAQPAEQGTASIDDAPQLGLGLRLMSAKRTNLQLDIGIEYREAKLEDLGGQPEKVAMFNMLLGGRLYPLRPAFSLGNLAVRPTLAARGGLSIGDAFGPAVDLSAGMAFSFGNDPNGFVIEVVGRPIEYTVEDLDEIFPDVTLTRSWVLRAGFQFGPG